MVKMPVSSIADRQRFFNAVTVALARNGLRSPGRYHLTEYLLDLE